ncbi:MAG: cysteine desulfurase [Rhizobiaceae bacterium]|nr:cysteine desulfurase [Rhizobiaceae bacterium]
MSGPRIYLDYNATAPLLPAAREAMLSVLSATGNPSSVHREGRAARRLVESARQEIAALVGAKSENVVFTSGATEAASTLLAPDWTFGRGAVRFSRLYVCAADHPCTLSGGRFPADAIMRVGVDADGVVDVGGLAAALAVHDAAEGLPLVALHLANNESGVIQPVARISAIVKAAGGVLVLDAVQAAGRIPIDLAAGHGDFVILSAHKLGGPAGVGAFVGAASLMMPEPLVRGGGHERGHRAGTENVAGIAGFGAAARCALEGLARMDAVRSRRDRLETVLRSIVPDAVVYGAQTERLPNTVFFGIPGIKAETAQIAFDLAGIAVSAGSACSSGKVGPSHVLKAMGVASGEGGLRVSLGEATSDADIDRFAEALRGIVARRPAMGGVATAA